MAYDDTVPQTQLSTHNYLVNNRFKFHIQRCPFLTQFCQRINLPTLSFGVSDQANPTGIAIPRPGTRYAFDDITVGFLVDENMKNWLELYDWMKSLGIYESCNEPIPEDDKVSNAYLDITNSAYVPIIRVNFYNMFPVMLTGLDFDSTLVDTDPSLSAVTFRFTHYLISGIT